MGQGTQTSDEASALFRWAPDFEGPPPEVWGAPRELPGGPKDDAGTVKAFLLFQWPVSSYPKGACTGEF